MHASLQDARYALRLMRKNLGLTLVMMTSLSIGIGANSAVFSVVDALLLRPLPYPQPERLAAVWLHSPALGILRDWPSPGQFIDLQNENHSFDQMALAQSRAFTLTGRDDPERISGMRAQSSLLQMLGAKPSLGRLILPAEDRFGPPPVAILTNRLWKRLFNSDPGIVGKSLTLNGNPFTVAGVLRPDFLLSAEVMPSEVPLDKVDVFLSLPLDEKAVQNRGDENYNILVRLQPGVSLQQAQADVAVIAARIRDKDKRDRTFGMDVVGLQEQVVGDVRRAVLVLLGSVALVLLIACANVGNLLLTRAAGREKEVAIRTALGAGWLRLARQFLTESILLALCGGVAGLAIARLSLIVVRTLNPGNIPRLDDIEINGAVLAFTFGISAAAGTLFGVAPLGRALRVDLNTSLRAGGRSGHSDGGLRLARHRLRGLLVVSEFTLSLILLVGAGLLVRSFVRLQDVHPGFINDHVLTMQVAANGSKYRQPQPVGQLFREIESRIARLPGVRAVGVVSVLPLTGQVGWGNIQVEGYVPPPGQELQVDLRQASTDYFRAMGIPLLQGRYFSEHDALDTSPAAVIEERFARRFWPHENAVGKHLWFDAKRPFTIVGVVGTVKQYGLDVDGKIATYFSQQQMPNNDVFLVAHTMSDPALLSAAAVREIHAVDPEVVVYGIRTMQRLLYDSLARQRFSTTMLGAFAIFALLLAAEGIYGVLSHLVAQSTHDIGVRVALGARSGSIVGLVLRQGFMLLALGTVAGLAGAAVLTRVMSSLLFGVSATDALTFTAVPVLLSAVSLAAMLVPARRAAGVDPIIALRDE